MELVLKVNELGYQPFIDCEIDSFIIGLNGFCINQNYVLSIKKIASYIKEIKDKNKKIYLNINMFASDKELNKFKKVINQLLPLNIDGFVVSDLGVLNILKKANLVNKVILDLHTYVTNKYSAKSLLNLGVKRVCVSKEITLEDIKEISLFNKGNIEVLAHGFYPITYSKRSIVDAYYKNFNICKKETIHYIKEESRDSYYCLTQNRNNLTVYYDKQYCVFPYLKDLIESNISCFRIDADFLGEQEIKNYIELYKKGINSIVHNDLESYSKLAKQFMNDDLFETPFMNKKSFLLKEEK